MGTPARLQRPTGARRLGAASRRWHHPRSECWAPAGEALYIGTMPVGMGSFPSQTAALASSVTEWLDQHGGVVAVVGVVVAAAVVWYVYRDNVRSQRNGVLDALDRELEMHRGWVGNEHKYIPGQNVRWWEQDNSRLISTVIFKLSTVAVDAAIANGPSLFLNRGLLPALVGYQQTLGHFNQLVDQAAAVQANPELWRRFPSRHLIKRLRALVAMVHYGGIGHSGEGSNHGANYYFQQVTTALQRERRMRVRATMWLIAGLPLRTKG